MFSECGYQNIKYTTTVYKNGSEDDKIIDTLCKIGGENLRQQYEAYQYIVTASK
jgi:hypothetical protein